MIDGPQLRSVPFPASIGYTLAIVKSPRAFSGCGYLYLQPHFSYLLERHGRSRHRDNEGTAAHRRRPAGPSPQGARGPLRADGRAGGRAIPAGEQLLLQGEGVREVLLPLHQPRLGTLRLLYQPRLRLPRRAREARPPPPRVNPLAHPRHRALHEGRPQQDDHGRGRRPLRTHGLLLRIRVRKEGKGTREEGRSWLRPVEGLCNQDPIRT